MYRQTAGNRDGMCPVNALIGDVKVGEIALARMRQSSGTWAAYQCMALDSSDLGALRFMHIGPTCTYQTAPEALSDTHLGIGWRFRLVGFVNLATGEIQPEAPEAQ